MKLAVCHGGWVISPNDGDQRFISAKECARLYGISLRYVILARWDEKYAPSLYIGLYHLHPKSDSNYELPKELKERLDGLII